MPLIRKILVPMDPTAASIAALAYASSLAEEVGAAVDVLHVHEHDDAKVSSTVPPSPDALQWMEAEISRTARRLGNRLGRSATEGDPLMRIVEAAAEGDYDLVVMGTHGRVGRLRMLIGSVAGSVVQNAPCPVLTVRIPGGEESFAERLRGGESLLDLVRKPRPPA